MTIWNNEWSCLVYRFVEFRKMFSLRANSMLLRIFWANFPTLTPWVGHSLSTSYKKKYLIFDNILEIPSRNETSNNSQLSPVNMRIKCCKVESSSNIYYLKRKMRSCQTIQKVVLIGSNISFYTKDTKPETTYNHMLCYEIFTRIL